MKKPGYFIVTIVLQIFLAFQGYSQGGCHSSFTYLQISGTTTIDFTDQSTSPNEIISWAWDFGDGTASTDQNPTHTYAHAGTYNTCLVILDDHNCHHTSCHHVVVHEVAESCQAAFSFTQTPGSTEIVFTDESESENNITSWLWDFGDGHSSTLPDPGHTYAHEGVYDVCLLITTETGCHSEICHSIAVEAITLDCHASFNFVVIDDSLAVVFTDLSSSTNPITSWYWEFGDGNTSTNQNPAHIYPHPGMYTVCLTITDDHGCTNHACHDVVIHALHEDCHAAFQVQPTNDFFTFDFNDASTSSNPIVSWLWNFGDGTTDTTQNPTHSFPHAGTYEVCLTIVDSEGCHDVFCHHVVVHDISLFCHASWTAQMDTGNTVIFTNTSTFATSATSWLWDFGDGATSTEENPVHTYASPGTYLVCLFIHDSTTGCFSHFCHHVQIHHDLPDIHHHPPAHHNQFHSDHGAIAFRILQYTNPAREELRVDYSTDGPNVLTVEIFDVSGNLKQRQVAVASMQGQYQEIILLDNLLTGLYFISFTTNQKRLVRNFSVVR